MIDDEYFTLKISPKLYDKIESCVVDLYLELGINRSPIDPWDIATQKGYAVMPYSKLRYDLVVWLRNNVDGGISFYSEKEQKFIIYYDDSNIIENQRFTLMHEIGHIILGHKEESDLAKQMANYFATYSLAPSPLIGYYCCEDFVDVMFYFTVSEQSANYSFTRYLNRVNFGGKLKDYEHKLLNQFENNKENGV